ncbi:hypothetical protein ACSSVQ_001371 [Parvibaculum sp. MBR-TMA-1.3b-4.2]|jgi:hypothetical protein
MNEGLATEQKTFRLQWRDRAGITPASPLIDGRRSYSAPAVKSIQPVRRSRSLKSSSIASFELTKFAIRAGAEYQNRHSSGTQSLRSDTLNCRDYAFVHVHKDSPPKNKPTRQTDREQDSLQIEKSGGYIHVEFAADNLRVSLDPPDDCRSTLPDECRDTDVYSNRAASWWRTNRADGNSGIRASIHRQETHPAGNQLASQPSLAHFRCPYIPR